jgi:glycosyltransferase involved in cell wall biosynthesis
MASRVAVISSNTGGIPEVNVNGYSGFLSDVGDIDNMVKNALHILSDEQRLKTFKVNARHQAEKFDLHAIVPKYEAIYEDTLSKCLVL